MLKKLKYTHLEWEILAVDILLMKLQRQAEVLLHLSILNQVISKVRLSQLSKKLTNLLTMIANSKLKITLSH